MQPGVEPTFGEELEVCAFFFNLATVKDNDAIRVLYGRESMRDHE